MRNQLLVFCFFIAGLTWLKGQSASEAQQFIQLRSYTFANAEQEARTDAFLAKALLPALHRQGLSPIGVFKLRPESMDSLQRTYVLIPFNSLEAFAGLDEQLDQDTDYLSAGADYLQASHEQPPYQRIESVLMRAFADMPQLRASTLEGSRADRVYELRSYESPNETYGKNKVDMFNAGGEVVLFDELGFNAVFYGEVISGAKMPNLMYMTTFSDRASRDEHWKAFGSAPKWKEISSMPRYQNNVSHIDIYYLYPVDYSDY